MRSDFEVEIFAKILLVLDSFRPWGDFLSLHHCLVKRDIEWSIDSCSN
jgi:hypothetical protein